MALVFKNVNCLLLKLLHLEIISMETSLETLSLVRCYLKVFLKKLIACGNVCACTCARSVVSDSATLWSPPGSSVHGIFQARILE